MNDRFLNFIPHRHVHRGASLAIAAVLLAAGCAAPSPAPSGTELNPGYLPDEAAQGPDSSLDSLAKAAQSHEALPPADTGPLPLPAHRVLSAEEAGTLPSPTAPAEQPSETIAATPEPQPPAPALTTEEQIAAKVAELRALIAQRSDAQTPLAQSLSTAALDAFIAGDAKTPALTRGLSPAEVEVATATRELFSRLQAESRGSADTLTLAGILASTAETLTGKAPVRISDARLCTKVESFGRFEPFTSNAFLAGRQHRVIVYVELDRFSSRPANQGDSTAGRDGNWVVELSQELELIHDADGRQQWYRPAQNVIDASRTRRRDFYLVNMIELPATLSVGSYSLKVIVRDKTTGSVDERVVPIQIIADGSALQSPRSLTQAK